MSSSEIDDPNASDEGNPSVVSAPRGEFTARVLIVLALSALFVGLGLLLWSAVEVFLLGFSGLLVALLLRGMAEWVGRSVSIPVGWALGLVALLLLGVVGLGGWFMASEVASQLDQLSKSLKESLGSIQGRLERYEWGREALQVPTARDLMSGKFNVFGRIGGVFITAFGAIANLVIVLFVGLYAAADPATYRRGILHLVPTGRRARAEEVLQTLGTKLRWWLLGRAANMTVVGLLTTVGLWMLGVPLALALGFIAFVLDFIPYIGPIASAVPAVLVGLTLGPMQALYVGLLYFGVQSLESYLLTPLVQQRAVQLPPALTILAQVLLGMLAGVLGLALATPLTVVGVVLVRKLYVEDVLGDTQ